MGSYRVGLIGGDGIGPEVVAEALKVVGAAGVTLDTTEYDLGADRYVRTGEVLPDAVLEELRATTPSCSGRWAPRWAPPPSRPGPRAGAPAPSAVRARPLRQPAALHRGARRAGARTATSSSSGRTPRGPTPARAGSSRKGTPFEVATQGSVNTRHGVERCVRFAFELAATRPRHHLTLVHKTNVLTFAGDLWQRTVDEVAADYPAVTRDYNHVDATCIYLVENAARYDVIVTDNLFGDILTDLAGAVAGGIGYAASANLNPDRTGPSLFEPVHGAAHDIAGTGRANPAAAIRSAALMLDHLGEASAADEGDQGGHRLHPLPTRTDARPPPPSATPSQKGSEPCPSPPPRRSGWTASSSTGPTPPCTS